uniref:Uncharacterized protein n=1 Tax=viral metagenome TaxID=1070528 RepID=A0A6M3KXN3_9ZZZZ
MKKENHLENLWNILKGLGQFSGYKDYAEYRQEKFGISPDKTISELAEKVELKDLTKFAEKIGGIQEKKEKFVDTLEGKEQKDFSFLFGEEEK